jgi:hypothetical protein
MAQHGYWGTPVRRVPSVGKNKRATVVQERCAICRCPLHRTKGTYATLEGRGHASKHHFVAERFFERSKNRAGTQRERIFAACPWDHEGKWDLFCFDCHELLLHNPVLLPEDIQRFSQLVDQRGLSEHLKPEGTTMIAERIKLVHEVISRGLVMLLNDEKKRVAKT